MTERAIILVVEDNHDILESVQMILQQSGFDVIASDNCQAAYDYLMHQRPDLILTDLSLPKMTGLEFIHLVRRMPEFDCVPIVAMSAFDEAYLLASLKAGANRALHKPEGLDNLVETIHSVIKDGASINARAAETTLDVVHSDDEAFVATKSNE